MPHTTPQNLMAYHWRYFFKNKIDIPSQAIEFELKSPMRIHRRSCLSIESPNGESSMGIQVRVSFPLAHALP